MTRTLLIDGDTLVFEAAAAHEFETQWEPWLWTLHGDLDSAVHQLDDSLREIKEKLKGDRLIIALSDEERWRPSVMPLYKGNRKTRKPVTYKALRGYCHEQYEVFQRPTLEGDDVLGILATHPKFVEGEKIVVSIDKDMKTIPGQHLDYGKARGNEDWESFIQFVSLDEANYFHLLQSLMGDKTDGYGGCPGIGPVSGEKLLTAAWTGPADRTDFDIQTAWQLILGAYAKKGLGEEIALQNARVARICRASDYDFKKKEVILWTPQ